MRETLIGITSAQRALAPRGIEQARHGTTRHNGPSSHVRFGSSWQHSVLVRKNQKVQFKIVTSFRRRLAQRIGVQLPRALHKLFIKTPISCAKRSTATPCWASTIGCQPRCNCFNHTTFHLAPRLDFVPAQRGRRNAGECPQQCLCPLRCAVHQLRAFVCIEAGAVHAARRTVIS